MGLLIHYVIMKSKIPLLLLGACLLSVFSSQAAATVLFSENFEYDTSVSTALAGRNGGTGFTSAWSTTINSGNLYLTSGGLSYQIDGGAFIDGGQTALRFDGSNTTANNSLFNRSFESYNGDELFISYLFQIPVGTTLAQTKSTGIWLNNDNNWIYNYNATGTGSFGARIGGSSTNDPVGPMPVPGTTYFVVARLSKTTPGEGASYNKIELWLNPGADDSLSTPLFTAIATGPTGAVSAYDLLGYRTNLASGSSIILDNIVAGTDWNSVAPIPEPGSLVFVGLAASAFLLTRRRKKEPLRP